MPLFNSPNSSPVALLPMEIQRLKSTNFAVFRRKRRGERAILPTSSRPGSIRTRSIDLLSGDSGRPYECTIDHRRTAQFSLSSRSYYPTNMKFDWISEIIPSTNDHSNNKQWADPFHVSMIASHTLTVCILITWSWLARILKLWEIQFPCSSSSFIEENSLSTWSRTSHTSTDDEQEFSLSTLGVSLSMVMHRGSSIQMHVDRPSKQRIEFSKNCHFSFFHSRSLMKNKRNTADILPVHACWWEVLIDIRVDPCQTNS